jgi:hypothetical protein
MLINPIIHLRATMKRLLALTMLIVTAFCVAGSVTYPPDKIAEITGIFKIIKVKDYLHNKKVRIWVIESDTLINLGQDDGGWGPAYNQKYIGLVSVSGFKVKYKKSIKAVKEIDEIKAFEGFAVKAKGILYNQSTGHQYEKILMDLKEVQFIEQKRIQNKK